MKEVHRKAYQVAVSLFDSEIENGKQRTNITLFSTIDDQCFLSSTCCEHEIVFTIQYMRRAAISIIKNNPNFKNKSNDEIIQILNQLTENADEELDIMGFNPFQEDPGPEGPPPNLCPQPLNINNKFQFVLL